MSHRILQRKYRFYADWHRSMPCTWALTPTGIAIICKMAGYSRQITFLYNEAMFAK